MKNLGNWKNKLKKPFLFTAALSPVIIIACWLVTIYTYSILADEMKAELLGEMGYNLFILAGTVQSVIIASILYGGIVEELLLRLFVMSLFAFIFWKLFYRKTPIEQIPPGIYITANILAAILFAAGHLPATAGAFGALTPLLIFRCFLLNGAFGIVFGWLYRKYGIQYAMLGHAGFHIVSKVIWLIFI